MWLAYHFQGQKVKVTRPTNAYTFRAPYLPNGKAYELQVTRPTNAYTFRAPYLPNGKAYELQTWYTDGWRRPALATGAMTSKVKGQGRKVTWSVWAVLAQCCTCVIRGRRGHTVSAEPGGQTSCYSEEVQPFQYNAYCTLHHNTNCNIQYLVLHYIAWVSLI